MPQIEIPPDRRLIDFMRAAHEAVGGKMQMTEELRKKFWEFLADCGERDYHNYMKWYGDEYAVEKRIFDKFKRGLSE